MLKWIPFIVIVIVVFSLGVFLFLTGQPDMYVPTSSNPAVVYREACARCHGEKGEGGGFLTPAFRDASLTKEKAQNIIRDGEMFMPSFPQIPDSTLNFLVEYLIKKKMAGHKQP
jgi:mono/diheme cytochrome c family protein